MQGVEFFITHKSELSVADDALFLSRYETFLTDLRRIALDLDIAVLETQINELRSFFSAQQKRYLSLKEHEAAQNLAISRPSERGAARDFSHASVRRLDDLKRLVDFSDIRRVVMVGCGAFPSTIIWLHSHFPDVHYVGLDIDETCVSKATDAAKRLGIDATFTLADGSSFNYENADFVYVANHVTPKAVVLNRICDFPNVRQLVVREPTSAGRIFAESAEDALPDVFTEQKRGDTDATFFSYDLWLGRRCPN